MGESMIERKNIGKTITHYDPKSDALQIIIQNGAEEEFIEIADGISIELNKNKEVIGIEILNASRILAPFIEKKIAKD